MPPVDHRSTPRWAAQIEQLYVEREDHELLLFAAGHHERLRDHPLGALYDEVAERILWHDLREGNLEALAATLEQLRPESFRLALVKLAEAVTALAPEGPAKVPDRKRIREILTGFEVGRVHISGCDRWWRRIGPVVLALATEPEEEPRFQGTNRRLLRRISLPLRREVTDFLRFERRLTRHREAITDTALPGRIGSGSSRSHRLWNLFRALRGFRTRVYRSGHRSANRLRKSLAALTGFEDLGWLPVATNRYLVLFLDLLAAERMLGRARLGYRPEEIFQLLMARWQGTLATTPNDAVHPLLEPLHISCHERWIDLLPGLGQQTDPLTGAALSIPLDPGEPKELTDKDLEPLLGPWRRGLLRRTLRG